MYRASSLPKRTGCGMPGMRWRAPSGDAEPQPGLPRLRRTVAPDAGLPAPRRGCSVDVALVGDALGQLRPAPAPA
jgi:hypothetical protein